MASSQLDYSCPRCGHDRRVKKVSAVYAEEVGTQRAYSRKREHYINREVVSELGQKLAPPPEYSSSNSISVFIFVASTFVCGIIGMGSFCNSLFMIPLREDFGYVPFLLFFGVGMLMFVLWALTNIFVWRTLGENKETENSAKRAYERWDQLFYCELHDIAFIPGTDIIMPSDKVKEYVAWFPSK